MHSCKPIVTQMLNCNINDNSLTYYFAHQNNFLSRWLHSLGLLEIFSPEIFFTANRFIADGWKSTGVYILRIRGCWTDWSALFLSVS